jgi:hypothetical protein
MKSLKTIIPAVILVLIIGGAIYYFGFMRQPSEVATTTVRLGVSVPKIDTAVFRSKVFNELKVFAPIPLNINNIGSNLHFTKINFIAPATTTQE